MDLPLESGIVKKFPGNAHTTGTDDQYAHFIEKAVGPSTDVEWVLRLYNRTNPTRHSRLSFYTFNLGSPAGEGNGSYMEYGVSSNDETPIELGKWVFVVGEAEPWISPIDRTTGCVLQKQALQAARVAADIGEYHVLPDREMRDRSLEARPLHPAHGNWTRAVLGFPLCSSRPLIA
jgi:hypothetical protein